MSSLILDDRNPEIIYSAGWTQGGSTQEYNGTTTYTNVAGANFSITFQGISIGAYGTIGSSNSGEVSPETSYQLDENDAVTYQPTLMTSAQHYQQFYQSPQVPKGQHTLIVTNLINGSDIFIFDYLIILTGNDTSSTSSSTPTTTGLASHSEHNRTVVIAGSTVSAVIAGILLFGLTFFLLRRRKRREWEVPNEVPSNWGTVTNTVSPFQGDNNTMSQRPASDNPKSIQALSSVHEFDAGTSSHRDSVSPPAYLP